MDAGTGEGLSHLSETQKRAFMLADDKLAFECRLGFRNAPARTGGACPTRPTDLNLIGGNRPDKNQIASVWACNFIREHHDHASAEVVAYWGDALSAHFTQIGMKFDDLGTF